MGVNTGRQPSPSRRPGVAIQPDARIAVLAFGLVHGFGLATKLQEYSLSTKTIVMRDKQKVSQAELKPGLPVVADACGDSLEDLLAVEVRIVPAPATP